MQIERFVTNLLEYKAGYNFLATVNKTFGKLQDNYAC